MFKLRIEILTEKRKCKVIAIRADKFPHDPDEIKDSIQDIITRKVYLIVQGNKIDITDKIKYVDTDEIENTFEVKLITGEILKGSKFEYIYPSTMLTQSEIHELAEKQLGNKIEVIKDKKEHSGIDFNTMDELSEYLEVAVKKELDRIVSPKIEAGQVWRYREGCKTIFNPILKERLEKVRVYNITDSHIEFESADHVCYKFGLPRDEFLKTYKRVPW